MICAPIIAIAEIVSGGALSAAIGGALGSQVLGGAVLGLVASGGNPMGAVLGGLGGAAFGGEAGAAGSVTEAGSTEVLSNAERLAEETVGNAATSSADELTRGLANGTVDSTAGIPNATNATSASTTATSNITDPFTRDVMSGGTNPSDAMSGQPGMMGRSMDPSVASRGGMSGTPGAPAQGGGMFDTVENFAKKNPTMTKIGLGVVQGIGNKMAASSLMEQKYKAQRDLEEQRRQRAYSGINYNLPFQPGAIGRAFGSS